MPDDFGHLEETMGKEWDLGGSPGMPKTFMSDRKIIVGTLVIIAPETASEEQMVESAKAAGVVHNGPVMVLYHDWQAMSGDELRAELDRIESALPDPRLDKSG